jgi:hypothetical protein
MRDVAQQHRGAEDEERGKGREKREWGKGEICRGKPFNNVIMVNILN